MPFSRLTRAVLVAPPLGGAFLGVLALLFAGLLLLHHGHGSSVGSVAVARAGLPTTGSTTAAPQQSPVAPSPGLVSAVAAPAVARPAHLAPTRSATGNGKKPLPTTFERTIPSSDLLFLNDLANQPSSTVLRDSTFRQLVGAVTPFAPFHFGTDKPLSNALEEMFSTSEIPVQIRDNRYVMVTGRRTPESGGRGRTFLWVDMQQGIALGGIFFYPSNGEPSPTLTLFSNQVSADSVRIEQLPPAFLEDFSRWSADAAVPLSTARYFINASNKKSVLAHDEDTCGSSAGSASLGAETCTQQKLEAAAVDRQAGAFLARVHYAPNGTAHTLSDPFQTFGNASRRP